MKRLKIFMTMALLFMVALVFGQDSTATAETSFGQDLLGMSGRAFMIGLIWAYAGMIVNVFSDVSRRYKPSDHSPQKFSFKYWWSDNWRRIVITAILVPVAIVGCHELFSIELTQFYAFTIGFGSDHLIEIVKRRGVIKGAGTKTK